MKKEDIRKEIQLKLQNLQHREEKNNLIFKELISNRDIEKAENIMCFVSFRNEVDTHKFIKHMLKNNKNIYIPIIDSKKENFHILFIKLILSSLYCNNIITCIFIYLLTIKMICGKIVVFLWSILKF